MNQTKIAYVYRFVSVGGMEAVVFKRQLVKDFTSKSVLDKKFSECSYTKEDLASIYKTNFSLEAKETNHKLPSDDLLRKLLHKFPQIIMDFDEYDDMFQELQPKLSARQIEEAKNDLDKYVSPTKRKKFTRQPAERFDSTKVRSIPPGETPYLYGLERRYFSEVNETINSKFTIKMVL